MCLGGAWRAPWLSIASVANRPPGAISFPLIFKYMACLKFTYRGDSLPTYSSLCEVCGEDMWSHVGAFRRHQQEREKNKNKIKNKIKCKK